MKLESVAFSLQPATKMNPTGSGHLIFVICQNFGTPKIINFPFETNAKLIILGVQILDYIMAIILAKHWSYLAISVDDWLIFSQSITLFIPRHLLVYI